MLPKFAVFCGTWIQGGGAHRVGLQEREGDGWLHQGDTRRLHHARAGPATRVRDIIRLQLQPLYTRVTLSVPANTPERQTGVAKAVSAGPYAASRSPQTKLLSRLSCESYFRFLDETLVHEFHPIFE